MERPSKLSGEQGQYIEYLEEKLQAYQSKKTIVRSYLSLKKIVDDINKLVNKGLEIEDLATGEIHKADIISEMALMSKDDKSFDRIFKFIDKIGAYNEALIKMEEQITPEEIDSEREILKGDNSVEARVFR